MTREIDWNLLFIMSPLVIFAIGLMAALIVSIIVDSKGTTERERMLKDSLEQLLAKLPDESGEKGGAQS